MTEGSSDRRVYGTGTVYQQRGRSRWMVCLPYIDPVTGARKKRSKSVGTEAEGYAVLAEWQGMAPGQHAAEVSGPRTVRDLLARYLYEKDPLVDREAVRADTGYDFIETPLSRTVWKNYETCVAVHILPELGAKSLSDLTPAMMRAFIAHLETKVSSRTGGLLSKNSIHGIYRVLHAATRYGVKIEVLTSDPMAPIPLPVLDSRRRSATEEVEVTPVEKALSVAERVSFLDWVKTTYPDSPSLYIRWDLAFSLGLRQAEALGLTWDCIKIPTGRLTVRQQLVQELWLHGCETEDQPWGGRGVSPCTVARRAETGNMAAKVHAYRCPQRVPDSGGFHIVRETKTHKIRHNSLSTSHVEELAALQAARPSGVRIDPETLRRRGMLSYPVRFADTVFQRPGGGYLSAAIDTKIWNAGIDACGIDPEGRTVHSARHTAATHLIEANVPLATVQKILGHSTQDMTTRYVTDTESSQTAAQDALARLVGSA